MTNKSARASRWCLLISLMLVACAPAAAQHTDRLGGNWNNPASAMITNIIMDRYARRRQEKRLTAKRSGASSTAKTSSDSAVATAKLNDASVHFRSTGTQLKTGEIANLIDAGNPQVLTIMTSILSEYEKGARAAGKPNDLALALSFFFATNASVYQDAGIPADALVMDLRDTIASALIEGNALNIVSDRQKQEMYEVLVLYTGFALAAYQEGKQGGNAESVKVSQQLAGQNLLAVTGISPEKISFTDRGLSIESEPAVAAAKGSQTSETIEHWVILREFRDNQVAAAERYNGKRVTITGAMDFVLVENGKPVIRMSVPAWSGLQMFCIFPVSQKAAVAQLAANQKVVMECTVRGDTGGVNRVGRVDLGSSVGRITLDNCLLK